MSEQDSNPKSNKKRNILIGIIIASVITGYVIMPKSTKIEFIDASENYVWVDAMIDSDLGTGLPLNYYNITIPNHEVKYDHHFYAQAFYNKTLDFCAKKPFLECNEIMMQMINEGNFRQQAGELNMTMKDRVSPVCFDNTKHAFCKSPMDLEDHLVKMKVMNKTD